jgi:hypothetical protein
MYILVTPGSEDCIQVRGDCKERPLAARIEISDYVAGTIHLRQATEGAELGRHPFRAFLLEERRRRNAAQLQVPFGDPVALTPKPLQAFANRTHRREFGNCFGGQRRGRRMRANGHDC